MEQYKQSKKNCKEGDKAEFVVKLLQGIGYEVFVLELVVDGNIHS